MTYFNIHYLMVTYFLQTECRVTRGDALALGVREGVEHAVMGVHAGKSVLLQLVLHYGHEALHPVVVVRPITRDLQA